VVIVSKSFVCRGCTDQQASVDRTSMDIGDGASLESVDTFCYLGDMLMVMQLIEARVCKGWNKFRQLVPLLTNTDICLLMRWKVHTKVVVHSSCTLHGIETWPVKKENKLTLQQLR